MKRYLRDPRHGPLPALLLLLTVATGVVLVLGVGVVAGLLAAVVLDVAVVAGAAVATARGSVPAV